MTNSTTLEYKRNALKAAQWKLEREAETVMNEPCPPWRDRPEDWVDRESAVKEALRDITDEIISLEIDMRDPEQYAEMRYELEAAIAFSGNRNDRAEWYLHTDEQERQFQERIQDQINYGYYDEDGGWNEGIYDARDLPGKCYCGSVVWEDDTVNVDGYFMGDCCSNEALAFMNLLAMITNRPVVERGRWGDEWVFGPDEMEE